MNIFAWQERVVDASVLIVLAKMGRLDLLTLDPALTADKVLITESVFQEVLAGKENDPARLALLGGFGARTPDVPIPVDLAARHLDPGEEATLALALHHGLPVVLDDGDGRRAARALAISFTGTAGLILEAKARGLIASASALIRQAQSSGWYAPSDALLAAELTAAGETWP